MVVGKLDQLERHYHRTLSDQWEFVRFVQEQNLDHTGPPKWPAFLLSDKT